MNTGGPAFPHGPLGDSIQHEDGRISYQWQGSAGMDLLDWMAGQALAGLCANPEYAGVGDLTNCAYDYASAMLSEKARREEDHSSDANKTVPSQSALIRAGWDLFTWADKTMDETDECRVFLRNWREAVRCQPEDHSPDAGKMAALEAANRKVAAA